MKLKVGQSMLTVLTALAPYSMGVYRADFAAHCQRMKKYVDSAPRTSPYIEFPMEEVTIFAQFCSGWMLGIQAQFGQGHEVQEAIKSFLVILNDISPEFDKLCSLINDDPRIVIPEFTDKVNRFPKKDQGNFNAN